MFQMTEENRRVYFFDMLSLLLLLLFRGMVICVLQIVEGTYPFMIFGDV